MANDPDVAQRLEQEGVGGGRSAWREVVKQLAKILRLASWV